jgi:cytochrome c oxidase assembly protein subunit 15
LNPTEQTDVWLSRFAKLVVLMTFALIFIGGHTTTSGAGMAFPDWPLSHDSVNPAGWWENLLQRLEHGHRLTAETVGLLVGILCAWIWRAKWAIPISAGVSIVLAVSAGLAGQSRPMIAHVGLWSAAGVFTLLILARLNREDHVCPARVRWLAFFAFLGVLAQAVLGGLRVTIESGGDATTATIFRVVHGCFAQLELCLLVAIAAMLSPVWPRIAANAEMRMVHRIGWAAAAVIFLQLIVGATMRHLGAGLAIPTFPRTPDGGWMPHQHDKFTDLNFTHTRFGAALVALFILALSLRAMGNAAGDTRLIRPAALLLALVGAQVTMGIYLIWQMRQPPILTTLHVVNGAAVLATAILLTTRAGRAAAAARTETAPVETVSL